MADEPETGTDDFASAFDHLAEIGATAPEVEIPETAPPVEAEAEAAPVEEPVEEIEASADTDGSPDNETPDETSSPKTSDDELLERFAKIVKQKDTPSPQETYVPEPAPPQEMFSAEEQEFLKTYEKDWPDVARAESMRRRAEYRDLVGYVFQEVAREISPLLQNVRALSERTHLADLHNTVEDYDDVRDKVIDWVGKQPAYLQPAYQHVIQQGTVDEVNDLISRWRQETGARTQAAAPAKRRTETELPTATKQAAASLAPVSSKRSAVIQGVDPNDFESAFSEFAGKM